MVIKHFGYSLSRLGELIKMKKSKIVSLILSGVVFIVVSLTSINVFALDISEEAKKAATRAVDNAISSILSQTVSNIEETEKKEIKTTAFITPSYTLAQVDAGSVFDIDIDLYQIIGGVVAPITDTLYVSGSLSYGTMGGVSGLDLDIYTLDASLIFIMPTKTIKSWIDLGANFNIVDVSLDNFQDTSEAYSLRVGYTAQVPIAVDWLMQGNIGFSMADSLESNVRESYAAKLGVKTYYKGFKKVNPYVSLGYQHSFSTISGVSDMQFMDINPGVDFTLSETIKLDFGYTYGMLLNHSDFGVKIATHTAAVNLKILF